MSWPSSWDGVCLVVTEMVHLWSCDLIVKLRSRDNEWSKTEECVDLCVVFSALTVKQGCLGSSPSAVAPQQIEVVCVNVELGPPQNTSLKFVMTQVLGKKITLTYHFCLTTVWTWRCYVEKLVKRVWSALCLHATKSASETWRFNGDLWKYNWFHGAEACGFYCPFFPKLKFTVGTADNSTDLLPEEMLSVNWKKFCWKVFPDYNINSNGIWWLYFQHTANSTGSPGQGVDLKSEILYISVVVVSNLYMGCNSSNGGLSTSAYSLIHL